MMIRTIITTIIILGPLGLANTALCMTSYCKSESYLSCNCNGYYHIYNNKCICDVNYKGSNCDIIITSSLTTTSKTTTTNIPITSANSLNLNNKLLINNSSNFTNQNNKNDYKDGKRFLIICGVCIIIILFIMLLIDYNNIYKF
jgi:hypothetical protein